MAKIDLTAAQTAIEERIFDYCEYCAEPHQFSYDDACSYIDYKRFFKEVFGIDISEVDDETYKKVTEMAEEVICDYDESDFYI